MKKENKFLEFLNSKGFYTALFTCLFAVLAIAAFVSIKNIDAISKLTTYGEKDLTAYEEQLQPAGIQTDTPISELEAESADLQSEGSSVRKLDEQKADTPVQRIKTEDKATEPAKQNGTDSGTSLFEGETGNNNGATGSLNEAEEQSVPAEAAAEATAEKTEKKDETKENPEAKEAPSADPKPEEKPKTEEKPKPSADASFDGSDMDWPLDGAIVMDFSYERAIYDKTLDQYRTNPTVSIGSEVGTQVKATADGIVKTISIDPRTGYTVVLDHGNGWISQYGQLQETILVSEGQAVEKGQAIGGVGTPTKYGVLLGSHLVFGISKDDLPQNPTVVLSKMAE